MRTRMRRGRHARRSRSSRAISPPTSTPSRSCSSASSSRTASSTASSGTARSASSSTSRANASASTSPMWAELHRRSSLRRSPAATGWRSSTGSPPAGAPSGQGEATSPGSSSSSPYRVQSPFGSDRAARRVRPSRARVGRASGATTRALLAAVVAARTAICIDAHGRDRSLAAS